MQSTTANLCPFLRALITSLILYDRDVTIDMGINNAMTITLHEDFESAGIIDSATSNKAILEIGRWGKTIRDDFERINPDFHRSLMKATVPKLFFQSISLAST